MAAQLTHAQMVESRGREMVEQPRRLRDDQVERYSRQIVLPEIGPLGQARLLASRVTVAGHGVAAERAVAYLAAAGVGVIVAPVALHHLVDPAQDDVSTRPLDGDDQPSDAALLVGAFAGDIRARRTLWIADGRAGELPPCATCAGTALAPAPAVPPELHALRDGVLGTVLATEIVKALLGIGTPLRGRVLTYDAVQASISVEPVSSSPACLRCAACAEGRP